MRRDEALGLLAAHREQLRAMGVERLSLFGWVARDEAEQGSDMDIFVEFAPGAHIGMYTMGRLSVRNRTTRRFKSPTMSRACSTYAGPSASATGHRA